MIAVLAALSAALAIGAGAFGAHGASSPQAAEWLRTGGLYQMVHAVAVLALLRTPGMHGIGAAMLAGAAIFAFTLYAMAFGGPRWLGAVTPIGGTVMILAWLAVAWRMTRV